VGITFVLTALVALAIAAGAAASFVSWRMAPTTLYGRRCRGWMPRCEQDVCIDTSAVEGAAFPVPIDYQPCTRSWTTSKIVGKACAFDKELYDRTGGVEGYDLCVSDAIDPPSSFTGSTIVFDDDFDSVPLASAKWAEDMPMQAQVSNVCGASNVSRPYEFADGGGFSSTPQALSFTGIHHRSASTADLSVPLGGHVEFSLIMGPLRYDSNTPASTCKPAYDGNLLLAFSIDRGLTWDTVATFTPYKYRGYQFSFVRQEIPPAASTNATRFRWSQPTFDPLGEYVAIDDVRIVAHSLPDDWQTSEEYLQAKNAWDDSVKAQQCCMDTEQCNVAMMPMSCPLPNQSAIARGRGFGSWHTAEALVFIAATVYVFKIIYRFIAVRLALYEKPLDIGIASKMSRVLPVSNPAGLDKPFPVQSFRLARRGWWQVLNAVLLASPILVLIGFALYSLSLRGFGGRAAIFLAIATLVDSCETAKLLIHTFQVPSHCRIGRRHQFEVTVSTDPETGYLKYGENRVPLTDLLDIKVLSAVYVWLLYLLTLLGGMPFALGCHCSRFLGLGLAGHRILVRTIGACAILRALICETFLVQLLLAFEWMFTASRLKRDEMGRAMRRHGVAVMATCIAMTCTALCLLYNWLNRDGLKESHGRVVVGIGIGGGILMGFLAAMLRGLPTLPHLYFTALPGHLGHAVIYERRVRCPCVHTCSSCSDVHARQVMFLAFLEDDTNLEFVLMLRGESVGGVGAGVGGSS